MLSCCRDERYQSESQVGKESAGQRIGTVAFPLTFANTPNWARHGIRRVGDEPFPSLMNTQILASEQPFSYRLALARTRTASFARRTVANASALLATELATLAIALLTAGFIRQWVLGEPKMVLGGAWVVLPLYVGGAALAKLIPGYGLGAALQPHGAQEAGEAKDVIGVHVREEDRIHAEPGLVAHHLPLRTLAAIEQHEIALALYREGAHPATNGRPCRSRPEKCDPDHFRSEAF